MAVSSNTNQSEFWRGRLEEYLESLRKVGRATGTIQGNKKVLTGWVEFALSHDHNPAAFDESVIEAFLEARNLSPDRRKRSPGYIRSWSRWSRSRDVRAWVVRAGKGGFLAQQNLDQSVVSISFSKYGDVELERFTDNTEFGEQLDHRFPAWSNNSARDTLWRFGKEIRLDDLVVMPREKQEPDSKTLIAIGRVIGPYQYDPDQDKDERHRRSVEWLRIDIPKEEIGESLLGSIDRPGTVNSLKSHDAPYRILCLAEDGKDPGERERGHHRDESEIWKERLEEYLDHLRVNQGYKAVTLTEKRRILGRWITYALEHRLSPVAFDETALGGFLDNPEWHSQKTRNTVRSHIKMWCTQWDKGTTVAPAVINGRSLQDRLEGAAATLLCDIHDLQKIVDLLADKGQVILYGPPGTGKTYLAQELAKALAPEEETRSLVQFHPAYSYEDFFEGYRPVFDSDKQMTYELTWGPLATLADHAARNPEQQNVMVIDEINRANLPRVLGELLFLFEYRDKSIKVMYRPDESFSLPDNLWFIGTMNTADRSIALIDAAMRRRFHFVPFFPEREPTKSLLRKWTQKHAPDQAWVVSLVSAVNAELERELGGDHLQLGPSHFMKTDLNDDGFKRVWEFNIEPFIEDQLFGQSNKIKRFRLKSVLDRYGPTKSDSQREPIPNERDEGTDASHDDDDREPRYHQE